MPLIIIVLIILVAFTGSAKVKKQAEANDKFYKNYYRITNAPLESLVFHNYIRHGYSLEECLRFTKDTMKSMGFDPCIPDSAYNYGNNNVLSYNSSYFLEFGKTIEEYDSYFIQERRKAVLDPIKKYCEDHQVEYSVSPAYVDSRVYSTVGFPIDPVEDFRSKYIRDKITVLPIGETIMHLNYGYCKIIDVVNQGEKNGYYVIKCLRTEKTYEVDFKDDNIKTEKE